MVDINDGFRIFVAETVHARSWVCEAEPIRPDDRRSNNKGMFGIVLKQAISIRRHGAQLPDRHTRPAARLFCGRICTRPAWQTLSVGALRKVKRLHQGGAEISLHKLVLDAATQEICP
jgi:hypothetical protein